MLMMPRWRESSGAVMEHHYAQTRGVPIAYDVSDLLSMCNGERTQ